MSLKFSLAFLALVMIAECGIAQDKSNDTTARYFLIQVSIGNLQEIAMGRIAADKGQSPEVKAFGQQMIKDHSDAEAQLLQLAKSRSIQLPKEATDPPVENPMLKNEPARDFDRVYVHTILPGHRQTVQLFSKYGLTGKDPAIRAFAQRQLPFLKDHLASIAAIESKLKEPLAR